MYNIQSIVSILLLAKFLLNNSIYYLTEPYLQDPGSLTKKKNFSKKKRKKHHIRFEVVYGTSIYCTLVIYYVPYHTVVDIFVNSTTSTSTHSISSRFVLIVSCPRVLKLSSSGWSSVSDRRSRKLCVDHNTGITFR